MELVRLGKRERFADEPGHTLAQGVEPASNMIGLSAVFAHLRGDPAVDPGALSVQVILGTEYRNVLSPGQAAIVA